MKRIAFVVSWLYKTFTPTTILVSIFHMCTCDDVALINEQSEKSTLKLFLDCRFHTLHTRVPTQKLMCLCILNIILKYVVGTCLWLYRNRPFNLIQNKVGYRSCFATGVKLEICLWSSFDVKYILEVIYCRPDCEILSKDNKRTIINKTPNM
jgi:hypothetical protein